MNFLIVFFILILSLSFGQKIEYTGLPSTVWPKLYDITYEKKGDDLYANPQFSKATKELNGKIITLPGYIFPYQNNSLKSDHFVFSSLPLASCFFCGVGGPETAIEVIMKQSFTYTNNPIEIRGKLILNTTNPDQLIYILKDAEFLYEVEF